MYRSHLTPVLITLLLWLSLPCHCQYDPFGGPPYYGEPQPYGPYYTQPEGPLPQDQPPQQYYPPTYNNNANLFNPFLPTGQNQNAQLTPQQQQLLQQLTPQQKQLLQQQLQQVQGSYPNLPSTPFKTVSPNNPLQRVDKYPFPSPSTLGNGVSPNNNNNNNNFNSLGNFQQQPQQQQQQQQQQQTFGSTLLNQHYPKFPDFPFQTIQPGQGRLPSDYNQSPYKPRIELPKIRVIEFTSSDYLEYGGGKLVQPKSANADLYVGGSGGDVPVTSKIYIECTGPNQVEWIFNGTFQQKNDLSVVTKNFQITIPEQRDPTPGSGEYTYLRLGLNNDIAEKDSGMYICRDRILPQNYISIRVIVAKPPNGKPTYPFVRPRDPNTIYFSRRDPTVVLPCKIENSDATISLHKHEDGKLSCPHRVDSVSISYDRFKGFILQTQAFRDRDLEGRWVCVGDFNGDLKLMKYRLAKSEDFATRYVEGEAQNVIALDGEKKSSVEFTAASTTLAQVDTVPHSHFPGIANLTAAGLVDPRSEFDIVESESLPVPIPKTPVVAGNKITADTKTKV